MGKINPKNFNFKDQKRLFIKKIIVSVLSLLPLNSLIRFKGCIVILHISEVLLKHMSKTRQ